MNNLIDGLFDSLRVFFRLERIFLMAGGALYLASVHYTIMFLDQQRGPGATDRAITIALGLTMVSLSSAIVTVLLSPQFGVTIATAYGKSQNATGVGRLLRLLAIVGQLMGLLGLGGMAMAFDWFTTSSALNSIDLPWTPWRVALGHVPALACVFGPSGCSALSKITSQMKLAGETVPSSRNTFGGSNRNHTPLP